MPLHLEKLKNQKVDARAEKRKRLIESDAFVIPSGRTVEEIDKYIREMRAESSIYLPAPEEAEQAMNVLEVNDSDREILQKRL